MSEKGLRMLDRDHPPGDAEVRGWIGEGAYEHWHTVTEAIDRLYPGIFRAEWLYGGKKHGWSLRYKKSRPLCTLVPEKGRFLVLLVFGAAEREKVEAMRDGLSRRTIAEYDAAATYHDGKWVVLTIDDQEAIEDLARLWAVKRKPKKGATASQGGTQMTDNNHAPVCGIYCGSCHLLGEQCPGCGYVDGRPFWTASVGAEVCPLHECCREQKHLEHCGLCADFACGLFLQLRDPEMSDEQFEESLKTRQEALGRRTEVGTEQWLSEVSGRR